MKTIHYLLIFGLLVPNFAFGYELSEDIVANKNIVSEMEDSVIPQGSNRSNAVFSISGGSVFGTNLNKYLAFWQEKTSDGMVINLHVYPRPFHRLSFVGFPFITDCVRNL